MKLKNKKTGKIVIVEFITDYQADDGTEIGFRVKNTLNYYSYPSLAELNEEWEDYSPTEPLIKDEKVRKAVRAWADANGLFEDIEIHSLAAGTRFSIGHYDIEFMGYFIYDLERNKTYNIDELCGEKE